MNDQELKQAMNMLYKKFTDNSDIRWVIAKAVELGMKYQEEKIKKGIEIVFENLNL